MTRRQDSAKGRITAEELRQALAENGDLLKAIVEEKLQQVLEAEIDEALQAGKGERTASRSAVRSQAVLVAIGINWEGRRNVLAVELASREKAPPVGRSC